MIGDEVEALHPRPDGVLGTQSMIPGLGERVTTDGWASEVKWPIKTLAATMNHHQLSTRISQVQKVGSHDVVLRNPN